MITNFKCPWGCQPTQIKLFPSHFGVQIESQDAHDIDRWSRENFFEFSHLTQKFYDMSHIAIEFNHELVTKVEAKQNS